MVGCRVVWGKQKNEGRLVMLKLCITSQLAQGRSCRYGSVRCLELEDLIGCF